MSNPYSEPDEVLLGDVIDSRDIIARLEWLEDRDDPLDEEEADELQWLRDVTKEGEGSTDWEHGAAFIADTYFTEYAQQLADDIGAINSDASWPACHIDWEAATESLKQDYCSVTFDGVEYWVRA